MCTLSRLWVSPFVLFLQKDPSVPQEYSFTLVLPHPNLFAHFRSLSTVQWVHR